jgi:cold shock CspA family protein
MGKVSALLPEKGYGFITHNQTGQDYFFHKSECLGIWDELRLYEPVLFTPTDGPKGLRATQVERP